MVDLYDSEKSIVLIDLSTIDSLMCELEDVYGDNINTTLLINETLPLLANRDLVDQVVPNLLRMELLALNKEHKDFHPNIRMSRLKTTARTFDLYRTTAYTLRDIFKDNNLYNASGVLKIDAIDADDISCAIASLGTKKWTHDLLIRHTSLTSVMNSKYLNRILISY